MIQYNIREVQLLPVLRYPRAATERVPGTLRSGARSRNGMKLWRRSEVMSHTLWQVWRTLSLGPIGPRLLLAGPCIVTETHMRNQQIIDERVYTCMNAKIFITRRRRRARSLCLSGSISTSYSIGNHIRVLACSFSAICLMTRMLWYTYTFSTRAWSYRGTRRKLGATRRGTTTRYDRKTLVKSAHGAKISSWENFCCLLDFNITGERKQVRNRGQGFLTEFNF